MFTPKGFAATARPLKALLSLRHHCAVAQALTNTKRAHRQILHRHHHYSKLLYYQFSSNNLKPLQVTRKLSSTSTSNMSDEDYANFLSKSQKDYSKPSTAKASSTSNRGVSSSSYPSIKGIGEDRHYTSESDEPFEEVILDWSKAELPDAASFVELVGADAEGVETQSTKEWDPKGQYGDITNAVSEAGKNGSVKVYKTAGQGARVVYYIVTVDEKHKKIVGVKVTAVES